MQKKAFTLIELLIVVAIIAILAAIAVPNFLEAQTRSKIARVKADFQAVATAVESYGVDNNSYPIGTLGDRLSRLARLSTPVSYLTSVSFLDPFQPRDTRIDNAEGSYLYYMYQSPGMYNQGPASQGSLIVQAIQTYGNPAGGPKAWVVTSLGPDREYDAVVLAPMLAFLGQPQFVVDRFYDPTNGTISAGEIARFGGAIPGNMFLP